MIRVKRSLPLAIGAVIIATLAACGSSAGVLPTDTPQPTVTPTPPFEPAQLSEREAAERLQGYFTQRFDEAKQEFEEFLNRDTSRTLIENGLSRALTRVNLWFATRLLKWQRRIEAEMTGQYQGDGMWLVKVTKVWQANGASGDSLLTHEQWLVPEDGETNPWEKL